jgi:drug/metabolite transporter (DMT)-like permease
MRGTTYALIACMFFGLNSVFSKYLLGFFSPLALAALASILAAVLLFLFFEVEHKVWDIFRLTRKEFITILFVCVIFGVLGVYLFYEGLNDTSATNAVLLTRLNPLLTAIFGVLFLGDKLKVSHLAGSFTMLLGIVLIATKNLTVDLSLASGDGLIIFGVSMWGVSNFLVKKNLTRLQPEVIVIWLNGLAGGILLGFTAVDVPIHFDLKALIYLLGLVIFVRVLARYFWFEALELTSACNCGVISLSTPLFGVFFAVGLLGESLHDYQIIGGTFIIAGLVLVEVHRICHLNIKERLRRRLHH